MKLYSAWIKNYLKDLPYLNLVIASRKSRLAMWQAEYVRAKFMKLYPQSNIKIIGINTAGDQIFDRTLFLKLGGKALFVKELEMAMIKGHADLAVHSLKDIPIELPPGFSLGCILRRGNPCDAFVSNISTTLNTLPCGAIVGTSSLRRQILVSVRYPHLVVKPLRGNLDARLSKLDNGEYHAIILAAAGLERLGLSRRICTVISPEESLPAPGQGAIAVEVLSNNYNLRRALIPLNHKSTVNAVIAERTLSGILAGNCQIPIAAFATVVNARIRLRALIASPDGRRIITSEASGPDNAPIKLAKYVAELLKKQDIQEILTAFKTLSI